MPTFSQLPSGKWRVQVRRAGIYRAATFDRKSEAKTWAAAVEGQVKIIAASGYAPPPKGATVADLIDKYRELHTKEPGKTKAATLDMLRRELGAVKLQSLSAMVLRDFIDRRVKAGAGGVTIGADLSFLSSVLTWGREVRRLDIPASLPTEARRGLKHRGLSSRSAERDREPSDAELSRLYAHWASRGRQRIPMELICRFALATAMRQDEICSILIEDVDHIGRTVVIRDRKDPQNKAGNDQTVPVLAAAWQLIEPVLKEQSSGYLFPFNAASVSSAFTRACAALGIDDLHFHDLRHRATADLFRMGLDIPRVALLTGHKTWGMLRRYTNIKPADVHSALEHRGKPSGNVVQLEKNRSRPAAGK